MSYCLTPACLDKEGAALHASHNVVKRIMMDCSPVIIRYLKKQHVLSLACYDGQQLWCASCYYVFNATHQVFWFMSDTTTRHGKILLNQPQIAGTISGQPKSVALIKGVQFCGNAYVLTDDRLARASYIRRFPVAENLSAPLWEVQISEIKMTDNSLGFGTKLYWQRA
ncbi:YhbP family protein [Enterobacteriaceae bacterium LUAb1]